MSSSASAAWRPQREVEIVAGTPPGGGLDRSARALVKAIESKRLLDAPARVRNIAGDGGRKAWDYLDRPATRTCYASVPPTLPPITCSGRAPSTMKPYLPRSPASIRSTSHSSPVPIHH